MHVPAGYVSWSFTGVGASFDRAGRRLAAIEPDAVVVFDQVDERATRIVVDGAIAVACFEDQLWAATHDQRWLRLDLEGHVLGEHSLPEGVGFHPAPCGNGAAATWASSPPLALIDELGQIARTEIAGVDLAVPLTGRRHLTACGAKLTLPSRVRVELAPGTQVLAGAITNDGKQAILAVATTCERQLLAIALGTGRVTLRCPLTGTRVRLATRRLLAVVQVAPRVLLAIDLRTGRRLRELALDRDACELAIDPDGRCIAVGGDDGRFALHHLRADHAATISTSGLNDEPPPTDATFIAARDASEPEPPSLYRQVAPGAQIEPMAVPRGDVGQAVAADPVTCDQMRSPSAPTSSLTSRREPLHALVPLDPVTPIDLAVARALLDRELRGVALWALSAIAAAWNTRRLGYGNESQHPFELEVAAIVGINTKHAEDHVHVAAEHLAAHQAAIACDPEWRSARTPIGMLAGELGLSACAIDILLVAAAPALRGEIARLYGILVNDTDRACVDELLVEQVLAGRHARYEIAAELDPRAPLVRLGILHASSRRARPFSALSVDTVVLDRLRAMAPDLGEATTLRHGDGAATELDVPRAVLARAFAALARRRPAPIRIVVRGKRGTGRKTLLACLCGHANRPLAVIDAGAMPRSVEAFACELAGALRRAHLAGTVPCVTELDEIAFGEDTGAAVAGEVMRRHPGPVAVVCSGDAPSPFRPGHLTIDLPVPAETERREVWLAALARVGARDVDIDTLAARYRIGPGTIRRAVAAARHTGSAVETTVACEDYIRQTRDLRLGKFARRIDTLASWSNVVLPPDILDSLRELVARVRHGRVVYDDWRMDRVVTTSRGLTALFQGPPGTGKTLIAGVIARELGLDLYQIDLSKVMSKWIGETERNLSTIFDAAEDGQVVLLFDEADSLFARRTEVRSSNDRYANLEVNYLLQRLDAFEGIAILTTNSGTSIDPAFKRRLSFRLSFPFPDEDHREQLWRAHLPAELPIDGELALDRLARKYQLSGGYIRNVCLRAAFLAAQEETSLAQHHLERAVALEYADFGKLSTSGAIA